MTKKNLIRIKKGEIRSQMQPDSPNKNRNKDNQSANTHCCCCSSLCFGAASLISSAPSSCIKTKPIQISKL